MDNNILKHLYNGDLKQYASVQVSSSNGYTVRLNVEQVEYIKVYATGHIEVLDVKGNLRIYSHGDLILSVPEN